MARPIRETPILFGEDARRFEKRMKAAWDEDYLKSLLIAWLKAF